MPSSTDCWGIEVGANAVKAVRLKRSGSSITIAEYDVVPLKKVLTTPDIDVDETIRLALDQFLSRHTIGHAAVVASVPGHMAFARFAKLPPVEPKRVPDIVKFEAVQQIPFPMDQVEWDYQVFQHADSPDVEVGIFAITKERVGAWLSNFHAVGMPVHALTLSPLAVYNALGYDEDLGDGAGTILMDIGTSSTDLIIVEQGKIWLRTIPIGGHHFTEALVRSFKLSYSKAEKIKREAATSKYARQIFQAMRPVFVDLVGEVQKSLGYYQSLNRDANLGKLIGLGSTFRLPGLQKFLKQQLQMDVQRLDTFKKIEPAGKNAAEFAENTVSLATAYGLALQGLEAEKVSCNILPTTLIRKQIWRSKQPWLVAATLIIATSAGLAYARQWYDRQQYEQEAPIRTQIEKVLGDAEKASNQWRQVHGTDPRLKIENLRRILDYRNVWPALVNDIDQALASADPQPELLSGDPKKIQAIPRNTRREIFIDQINEKYDYNGSGDADAIWEQVQAVEAGGMPPGYPGAPRPGFTPGAPGAPTGPAAAKTKTPPGYVVSISGYTPVAHGPKFLNETVVKWLTAHAQRDDRPYRIADVTMKEIVQGTRDLATDLPSTSRAVTPNHNEAGRTPNRVPGIPGLPGHHAIPGLPGSPSRLPPGQTPADFYPGVGGQGAAAAGIKSVDDMFPSDPLASEDRSHDWHFVVQFRVELIRPEDARKAEIEAKDKKVLTAPATPASAPVPPPAPAAAQPVKPAAQPGSAVELKR